MSICILLLTELQTLSDFTNFSTNVIFLFQDPVKDITLQLAITNPSTFLVFHDFGIFKKYQYFHKTSFDELFFNVFLVFILGLWSRVRITAQRLSAFLISSYHRYNISTRLTTGDFNSDHLVKVVPAGLCTTHTVIIFPFPGFFPLEGSH